ncbi:Ig-like domain-containing protein [Chitinophaga tropicalis]|uniref:T9SS type B sorting domain-containing protein n=1 Tax=Chitinophaga tropicalis TaxID=2683588 RepID=A0A7K1U4W1_9BACT|nr:gliding motility-associated C-terminal domain-containing protein [Chitinophaga tropicalis]MVT09397.1 T9SS type B sorting domain-containing protein [Chitinophaga tropicalis]
MKRVLIVASMLVMCACRLYAQTYTPVAVTGFNNDAVAETGTDALAVTTTGLDKQDKLLYTQGFAATNSLQAGIPDNGILSNGLRTYQLADYTANNCLYLSDGGAAVNSAAAGFLSLVTPAAYSKLSFLCFSTEQKSTLTITLHFTDGTAADAGTFTILDWFGGTNPIFNSYGRVARISAPPYNVEGLPSNDPRMYAIDITPACEDQPKLLESIQVDYISGTDVDPVNGGSRAVFLAVAGISYQPVALTAETTQATCGNANGSISLSVTSGLAPFSYEWSTTPAQTTATATDLAAGSYSCVVKDANGCPVSFSADVIEQSTILLKALAKPAAICTGSSTTIYAVPTGGRLVKYTWEPGALPDSSAIVTPAVTTMYRVTGEDANGCNVIDSVEITVTEKPEAPVISPLSICPDSTATLTISNAIPPFIYNWYTFPSGGSIAGTGSTYTTPGITDETTFYAEAVNNGCTSNRSAVTVTPFEVVAVPVIKADNITTSGVTFTWAPVPDATGYLVSVDNGPYVTPSSGSQGTSHEVSGLKQETVTIRVIALGALACQNSIPGEAVAKLKPGQIFIPNAFTPNGDGLNDYFRPEGTTISSILLRVFNQWGEMIYQTSDLKGWDGTYKGKMQPSGVYTYTVKVVLNNKEEIVRKGAINLLR